MNSYSNLIETCAKNVGLFESKFERANRIKNREEWDRTHLQNRNDLCNCLSGLKFKKCCGK